jgi:hypothetical protein
VKRQVHCNYRLGIICTRCILLSDRKNHLLAKQEYCGVITGKCILISGVPWPWYSKKRK